jgi:glycosyltransferase involved in cell wall biosynthesis
MVVVEALAAGLPVLASDLGGLPELVGAQAALPPRDLDAWTRTLTAWWADPALRARRGAAALARAREHHTADVYYAGLMRLYAS